jgi:hypothetical protein
MEFPYVPDDPRERRTRGERWIPMVLVVAVLGGALAAAGITAQPRVDAPLHAAAPRHAL